MNSLSEKIGFIFAGAGTLLTWLFGGWELGLQILIVCMILDYIMGLMCGYKNKELNSKIGFNGLKRKFTILIILILAVLLDRLLGQEWLFRTVVIYFYVAMEGLSILENAAKLDVPIPGKLKEALVQLQEKGQKKGMKDMKLLINDAGHGGNDPGATSNGNIEKEYTLEAALYVQKRLKELGLDSDVTRDSDITLSNTNRTNKVKQYKYCISHHFNAGGGSGAETIHSIYADGEFEKLIINEFKKAGYPVRPNPIYSKKNSKGKDYYFMHRETGNCRVTIVEYDFVDGPQSEKIKNKAYREGMYECVIRAICKRHDIEYKPREDAKLSNTLYRVQVGAYSKKENAENMLKELEKAGFNGFISESDVEMKKESEKTTKPLSQYYEEYGLKVIETNPDNVYVSLLPGKTLREFGIYGINGTWQNTREAHLPRSVWGLAGNGNKAIGPNSYQNSPNGHKRGTIIYYEDGTIEVKRINNINEIDKPFKWCIGGGMLIPDYNPTLEKIASDILRTTAHTGIGYKRNRIYLFVHSKCSMHAFRDYVEKLNLDGAIFLDGGGSTQMNYKGNKGIHSSRVFLKKA